jgi:hypothetical protein
MCRVNYDDLMELARLCLLRASAARTPATADALRAMAEEYQARAAALRRGQLPDIAEGMHISSAPEAPLSTVQQQQQPQGGSASAEPQSSPSTRKRP